MERKAWGDGNAALAERSCQVIMIEASECPLSRKSRVAAYIRVSTDSEDQENSFAAQNAYYTTLITGTPEWDMVDIYADEGITGTSVEKRNDFQRMMADCRRGLIDRIVVKSISRFARNTMECLETIRELKNIGVSVLFEEQNIDTADMSSEMVTAVHASFAQQESKSISDNVRWGFRRRMETGQFNTCRAPYGFRLKQGTLEIVPQEAEVVRYIFSEYLNGASPKSIATQLAKNNVGGRNWTHRSIEYILQNERYMGSALLMKRYSTDTLPHKMKYNHGERQMYLAEGINEAIISKEDFEKVKRLRKRRVEARPTPTHDIKPFSKKIRCGKCGAVYRSRTINGTRYWSCMTYDRGANLCAVSPVPENQLCNAFLRLYYNLKHYPILQQMLYDLKTIRERSLLWCEDIVDLNKQISEVSSQNQMLAELKKHGLIDPDIFIVQANELAQQLREIKLRKERLISSNSDSAITNTQELLAILEDGPDFLDSFSPELFSELIDQIIVDDNIHVRFQLKNALELPETIERTVR